MHTSEWTGPVITGVGRRKRILHVGWVSIAVPFPHTVHPSPLLRYFSTQFHLLPFLLLFSEFSPPCCTDLASARRSGETLQAPSSASDGLWHRAYGGRRCSSSRGVVAYCDERVCLSVCLSVYTGTVLIVESSENMTASRQKSKKTKHTWSSRSQSWRGTLLTGPIWRLRLCL